MFGFEQCVRVSLQKRGRPRHKRDNTEFAKACRQAFALERYEVEKREEYYRRMAANAVDFFASKFRKGNYDFVFLSSGSDERFALRDWFAEEPGKRGVTLDSNEGDHRREGGGWFADLFALKECAEVVRTDSSTFSWMAAWMGGKDLISYYLLESSSINCIDGQRLDLLRTR